MGLFDKMKNLASDGVDKIGADKLDEVVDKAADVVDEKTGGQHRDKIDTAAEKAKGFLEDRGGAEGEPPSKLTP